MSMNKKIIIKNYQQLGLDYALLFSFLTLNNIVSYHGIIPLSVSVLILVLTFFLHHKFVKKEIEIDNGGTLKFYLFIFIFITLFVKTCWFFDIFVEFIKNSISL